MCFNQKLIYYHLKNEENHKTIGSYILLDFEIVACVSLQVIVHKWVFPTFLVNIGQQ